MRVALADDHVAAVAIAAFEVASGGSVLFDRCDDLEKVAADRYQRILQAEHRYRWVDEADIDGEDSLEVIDHGREFFRHQADLTKPYGHVSLPHGGAANPAAA